jgi:hypothetical protein
MGFGFFSRFNRSLKAAILAAGSRDYLSLAPALQQVFFMGDDLRSGSEAVVIYLLSYRIQTRRTS